MAQIIRSLIELHGYKASELESTATVLPEVKGGYYDVDLDVGLFTTEFVSEDVDYFLEFFRSCKNMSEDALKAQAIRTLTAWIRQNSGKCPYEPFLWALKICDGIVGSINTIPRPNEHTLLPLVNALKEKWCPGDESVLKNVILNWDWYQPVHVALKLYELMNGIQDSEIDAHIAKVWLYDYMYSKNAYLCLLAKKKTEENIRAIMSFVSHDGYDEGRIEIDGFVRNKFLEYANAMTTDEDAFAYTYYRSELQNCSRNAVKDSFGRWTENAPMETGLEHLLNAYRSAKSEADKEAVTRDFSSYCMQHVADTKDRTYTTLIQETREEKLVEQIIDIFSKTNVNSSTQHILGAMYRAQDLQYHRFIEEQYYCFCENGIKDSRSLLYASAYCCDGHPELVGKIVREFYLGGKGFEQPASSQRNDIARYIVTSIRVPYSRQYYQAIKELIDECLRDRTNATALELVRNCRDIFSQSTRKRYPRDFDRVFWQLTRAAVQGDVNAPLYATTVVEAISKVAGVERRDEYYKILNTIHQTDAHQLAVARRKANEEIQRLFG